MEVDPFFYLRFRNLFGFLQNFFTLHWFYKWCSQFQKQIFMIILLSPAKTLDFSPAELKEHSQPRLLDKSELLINKLKKQSANSLKKLMSVSDNIAQLNAARYKSYATPFTLDNAKQAALAFKGDVYTGLEAETFNAKELAFAQQSIRILSGLYGLLKPLDLMQAYRLEMGTRLKVGRKKDLYEFWDDRITELINQDLESTGANTIINLASQEYFRSVKKDQLAGKLITVHFKEQRGEVLKVIAFNAKKARGRMAHLIVKEKIKRPTVLQTLVVNDYIYQEQLSNDTDWVFVKEE